MLIIAEKMRQVSFGALMEVYETGNLQAGQARWPEEPEGRQIALAEDAFYQYLRQVFFRTPNARYCIWEEHGHYISALRLEPYRDGFLLTALETAPEYRRKGYAAKLMQAALEQLGPMRVYSHVDKQNAASLRTHETCGFRRILEHSVYSDGSVDSLCCTLLHE